MNQDLLQIDQEVLVEVVQEIQVEVVQGLLIQEAVEVQLIILEALEQEEVV